MEELFSLSLDLYPNNLKSGHFGCAKAPRFDCRNWVYLSPIELVTAIESRELSRCPNAHFSGCLDLPLIPILAYVGLLLFFYMSLWFLAAAIKKRADLADIAWGPGFVLVAWTALILGRASVDGVVVNILVTIWATRLALHLYLRNRKREEDFRYQKLKQRWGGSFYSRLFTEVFLLQGCILYIVALPILWMHTQTQPIPKSIWWIALPLWLIGFGMEALADWELTGFKKDSSNSGKLLRTGLWRYVRHPNYLGELMQWWAIWLFAAFLPYGWLLVVSPLLITLMIVYFSGVKPVEDELLKRPEYREYVQSTPSLIPPSLLNGILFGTAWILLNAYGSQMLPIFALAIALGCYAVQLLLFTKFDRTSLRVSVPLSIIALVLGLLQETLFRYCGVVSCMGDRSFLPLFSLTLNSSLAFLNRSLTLAFFVGGLGAWFCYYLGEEPVVHPVIILFWGMQLVILVIVNRKLKARIGL